MALPTRVLDSNTAPTEFCVLGGGLGVLESLADWQNYVIHQNRYNN